MYEDALDLWEEAVKNASTEIKEQEPATGAECNFMGLFPRAIACLQLGNESLKKVLRILECYLILDPVGLMQVRNPHCSQTKDLAICGSVVQFILRIDCGIER